MIKALKLQMSYSNNIAYGLIYACILASDKNISIIYKMSNRKLQYYQTHLLNDYLQQLADTNKHITSLCGQSISYDFLYGFIDHISSEKYVQLTDFVDVYLDRDCELIAVG